MSSLRGPTFGVFAVLLTACALVADAAGSSAHPSRSGGGGLIAYRTDRADPGSGIYEIWTIHEDGTHARQLSHRSPESVGYPRYSLDGKLIGFTDNIDNAGAAGLAVMHADGSHFHFVIPDGTVADGPSFGPGGEFAYLGIDGSNYQVFLKRPGKMPVEVTHESRGVRAVALAPSGKWVTYAADPGSANYTDLFRIDVNGKHRQRLTHTTGSDYGPTVSPDNHMIVFECDREFNFELCLMHADGSHQRRLTKTSAFEYAPTFSPNGRQILFSSTPLSPGKVSNDSDLYTMHLDGTHRNAITTDNSYYDTGPAFDPTR